MGNRYVIRWLDCAILFVVVAMLFGCTTWHPNAHEEPACSLLERLFWCSVV